MSSGQSPPGGLEQNQGFDILGFRATALALLELEIGGNAVGKFERAERAGGGQQSGVRTGHLPERTAVQGERRFMLRRYACRHAHNIDI